MKTYRNFVKGISIAPKVTTESNVKGEIELLSSDNKLRFFNGTVNDPVVTETVSATLTNKIITGNTAVNLISGLGTLVLNTTGTITAPNGTDTLAGISLAQTLTNKTMSGASNTFTNLPSSSLPTDVVYLAAAQTLTNKTISGNTAVNLISGSGTLTLNTTGTITVPNVAISDTLVGKATTDTLTNKTLTSPVINTPTGIVKADVGLGNVDNTSDATKNAAVATLTNKTLTSPVLNTPTADTITGIAGGALTLTPALNQQLTLTSNGTGTIGLDNITAKTNTISTSIGHLNLTTPMGSDVIINPDQGTTFFQRTGTVLGSFGVGGLTLGSNLVLGLQNNSRTVNFKASPSASATYTVIMPAAAPTAGTALAYNGTDYVWGQAGGWVVGSSTALAAGGTVAISLTSGQQVYTVASSGGAVTLSTTPFGIVDPSDGTAIRLIGTSNTNTVTLVNNDAVNGCILNGSATLANGCTIDLQYILSLDRYVETSRNF